MCDIISDYYKDLTLICLSENKDINIDQIKQNYNLKNYFKIINRKKYSNRLGVILYYIFIFLHILKNKYDFYYCRHPFFLIPLFFSKKNHILELHDLRIFNNKIYFYIFKYLLPLEKLKKIIVISDQLKLDFIKIYPNISYKIYTVHDGASKYEPKIKKTKYLNGEYNFNLLYVGSLHTGKGLEVIEKLIPNFKQFGFHIVGGAGQSLEFWSSKLKIYKNVFFYGHIPHLFVPNYIDNANICLLPNQKNIKIFNNKNKYIEIGKYTSPLKLFEYMSQGKTIIASDLPNINEVLKNNYNSILCKSDIIEDWINAIQKVTNDNDLNLKIRINAKKDFEKYYTWEKRVQTIFNIK